jgi:hypothetical protein
MSFSLLEFFGLAVLLIAIVFFGWNAFSRLLRPFMIFHVEPWLHKLFRTDTEFDDAKGFYINTIKLQGGVLAEHLRQDERETAVAHLKEIAMRNAGADLSKEIIYVLSKAIQWHENIEFRRKTAGIIYDLMGSLTYEIKSNPLFEWFNKFIQGAYLALFLVVIEVALFWINRDSMELYNMSWIIVAWIFLSLLSAPTVYIPLYSRWISRGRTSDAPTYSVLYMVFNLLAIGWILPIWISSEDLAPSESAGCNKRLVKVDLTSSQKIRFVGFDMVRLKAVPDVLNFYDENCNIISQSIWKLDREEKQWSKIVYVSLKDAEILEEKTPIELRLIPYRSGRELDDIAQLQSTLLVEHMYWHQLRYYFGKYSLISLLLTCAMGLLNLLWSKRVGNQ